MKLLKKDIILGSIKVAAILTVFIVTVILAELDVYIGHIRIRPIGPLVGIICGSLTHFAARSLISDIKLFISYKRK